MGRSFAATEGERRKVSIPPAEPEALRLLAPQRGLIATERKFGLSNKECRTAEVKPARTSKFDIPYSTFCGSNAPFSNTDYGKPNQQPG